MTASVPVKASTVSQGRLATAGAFTLVEVMLALAVSAIVLAAIGGVFFSAMRLRERTTALLDEAAPMQQALSFLRRDLKGAVGPGGVMESDFRDGDVETAVGQGFGLQFCTTTGVVKDSAPWGDIQEVIYQLKDPTQRNANTSGRDLVRSITRNLLATSAPDYQDQVLLSNVKSLDFFCFDGSQWRDNWDTSLSDTNLPSAVRVRIQMAGAAGDNVNNEPIEMVVPLMTQPTGTNQSSTATSTMP